MQYEAATPEEYLSLLEKDWRKEKLEELRLIILDNPNLKEGINYKMLSFADNRGIIFHHKEKKNYVALYVGDANKIDPNGELLQGIDHGKGCIRLKKSTNISDTRIAEFIHQAILKWKEGEDIGC
ncbi:MAG: iron chaperone [Ekhidna sp.]